MANPAPENPREAALQSYSGQRMTSTEFEDAYAISGIIAREIKRSGSLFEARENFAFVFSKGKKISSEQAQDALSDVFKARYGQTMNEMREAVIVQDQKVTAKMATPFAAKVGQLIQEGETMPYYKALDQSSAEMAGAHGMTQNHAKALMKEAKGDLYDLGKELQPPITSPLWQLVKKRQTQSPRLNLPTKPPVDAVTHRRRHTQIFLVFGWAMRHIVRFLFSSKKESRKPINERT